MSYSTSFFTALAAAGLLLGSCNNKPAGTTGNSGWEVYGGNKQNNRYVDLKEIDSANVQQLKAVWTYHTNDADSNTQIQVNPIVIDTVLYGITPKLKLFALHAATGREIWVYDPVKDTVDDRSRCFFFQCIARARGLQKRTGAVAVLQRQWQIVLHRRTNGQA
ncbi:MAG TPA: hypothetical protein PLQ65_15535 [Flavihumibacter sp.]|nr:hypothetical protein [Flavihumibacter sp.]